MNKKAWLGNLVGAFIVIIIGFAMLPVMTQMISNISMEGNLSVGGGLIDGDDLEGSWGGTMLTIIPLFFVMAILFAVLGMVYNGLRSAGLVGGNFGWSDSRDLNGDGVVDENEEMLGELELGQEVLPEARYKEADTEVEQLTEAEEDLKNYKERNKKYHETIENDIKKDALYNEDETNVDQLSETKKGLESYKGKIKRFKDKMNKFKKKKSISEEDLKESKFD